jgi:hypothetical protein
MSSKTSMFARQQLETATKELFYVRTVPRCCRTVSESQFVARVEAGSNTSTVALLIVGGDEKGTYAWGYKLTTLFRGDINTGPPVSGSRESETVKCGHESHGTRTWEWLPHTRASSNCKQQFHPEKMLHKDCNATVQLKKIAGRESLGASHQDELIGGKPPVANWFWLSESVWQEML